MDINRSRTAVLALHWVGDIASPDGALAEVFFGEAQRRKVIEHARDLFSAARSAGVQVIYTKVGFHADYADLLENAPIYVGTRESGAMRAGSPTAEIISELAPQGGDVVVNNDRVGGFTNSSLEFELRRRGIDTVLIAGIATNVTVGTTARQASDLGFRVFVVEDCCSSVSQDVHERTLADMELLIAGAPTAAEVITAIGG